MKSNRSWYKWKSNLLIGGQVIATVATGGGAAAYTVGTRVGLSALVFSQEALVGSFAGLISGKVVCVPVNNGVAGFATNKAVELVRINSLLRKNGELNNEAFKEMRAAEKPLHLSSESPAPVLLFIGSKSTLVSEVANSFVRNLAPFIPAEFESFSPSDNTQILPFDYVRQNCVTRSYLICLCMENPQSKYYSAMLRLAEMLIPAASVACILADEKAEFVNPLLTALLPQPLEKTKLQTRVVILHKSRLNIRSQVEVLSQCKANFEVQQIEKFEPDHIRDNIQKIQRIFDITTVQSYSQFSGKLIPLRIEENPVELVWVNSMWGNGSLNEKARKAIEANKGLDKAHVLLLIGSKTAPIAEYANFFIRRIAPYTSNSFSSSHYTQILSFDYVHPGHGYTLIRGHLICLHMEKSGSKYCETMKKIAETLIPAASVTYIIEKGPVRSLFDSFSHKRIVMRQEKQVSPTGVIYGLRPEDGLTMEQVVANIKSDFDRADVKEHRQILEKIKQLSQA